MLLSAQCMVFYGAKYALYMYVCMYICITHPHTLTNACPRRSLCMCVCVCMGIRYHAIISVRYLQMKFYIYSLKHDTDILRYIHTHINIHIHTPRPALQISKNSFPSQITTKIRPLLWTSSQATSLWLQKRTSLSRASIQPVCACACGVLNACIHV